MRCCWGLLVFCDIVAVLDVIGFGMIMMILGDVMAVGADG